MLQERERERAAAARDAGVASTGVAGQAARLLASLSSAELRAIPVPIHFWDGSVLPTTNSRPPGSLHMRGPAALAHLLRECNELGLSRAWVAGLLDADGDLEGILAARGRMRSTSLTAADRVRILAGVVRVGGVDVLRRPPALASEAHPRGRRHSPARDRSSVQHHYELPSSFYRLFLGPSMVYSCAYFDSPDDTLEQAQERKLELICRKLRLAPGDRLLDIGCGWGSLILHAVTHHRVSALGVTLSPTQAAVANERAREAGVADRCEAIAIDYRSLRGRRFEAIASVGMYEHVGRDQLQTYVDTVRELLAPGGLFLNHGITRLSSAPDSRKTLISRFVFPDGELHPLTAVLVAMERAGLEIRDVESLREHYNATLRRWGANLAAQRERAVELVGSERERIWRLYIAGSASAFDLGEISVYQTLAVRAGRRHRLPLSRLRLISGAR